MVSFESGEAATGGVIKKTAFKNFTLSTGALLKRDSNTGAFL